MSLDIAGISVSSSVMSMKERPTEQTLRNHQYNEQMVYCFIMNVRVVKKA